MGSLPPLASPWPSPTHWPTVDRRYHQHLKTQLLVTTAEMTAEQFPLPSTHRRLPFRRTNDRYSKVTHTSPLYSVDCEMVETEAGRELARLSLVDSSLEKVVDVYVKPRLPVKDYLTPWSGITPQILREKEITGQIWSLETVQDFVIDFLPSDAILVGHSLHTDLAAMELMHPYVIDTSLCYNLTMDRRRRSKLSLLASTFLNIDIQTSRHGHDSIEDARAAMELVNLKLSKEPWFGNKLQGWDPDTESTPPPGLNISAEEFQPRQAGPEEPEDGIGFGQALYHGYQGYQGYMEGSVHTEQDYDEQDYQKQDYPEHDYHEQDFQEQDYQKRVHKEQQYQEQDYPAVSLQGLVLPTPAQLHQLKVVQFLYSLLK